MKYPPELWQYNCLNTKSKICKETYYLKNIMSGAKNKQSYI